MIAVTAAIFIKEHYRGKKGCARRWPRSDAERFGGLAPGRSKRGMEVCDGTTPIAEITPKGIEPWMKVALLGTARELKTALDAGLDPNTRTPEGTTLLMMAVTDPAKVQLLIDRGANVCAKAKNGYTALMVAATYQGTSESVKLLLAHGAEARPGKGVEYDASPLFLAASAGDLENMALLLKAGANWSIKDKTGNTALAHARSYPYVLAAFEQAGVKE